MTLTWNDKEPIYVQIHAYLAEMILAGLIAPGEALPSVRQVAVEQHVNPITVSKAMQLLVEDGVAVKRRGLGMYVAENAASILRSQMRARFLSQEWPGILHRLSLLELSLTDLMKEPS